MESIVKKYKSSRIEKCHDNQVFYGLIKQTNILSKFKKVTPDTLVEAGYMTSHHDARVKKLEIASCFLHLTILLFSFAYVCGSLIIV